MPSNLRKQNPLDHPTFDPRSNSTVRALIKVGTQGSVCQGGLRKMDRGKFKSDRARNGGIA